MANWQTDETEEERLAREEAEANSSDAVYNQLDETYKDTQEAPAEPTVKKPISITPMDAKQEDSTISSLKNEIKDSGPTGVDYGIRGAGQISSVLQEAMARRRGAIEGKDPNLEIQTIQKGQDQLDENVKRKEALRGQLQQRIADRQKAIEESKIKSEELGVKQRKEAIDTIIKERQGPSHPTTVARAEEAISRGVPGIEITTNEAGNKSANFDKPTLEKLIQEYAKSEAADKKAKTPPSVGEIAIVNQKLKESGSTIKLAPGASREEYIAADNAVKSKQTQVSIENKEDLGEKNLANRETMFKAGTIRPMPKEVVDQKDWLENESNKATKNAAIKIASDYTNKKSAYDKEKNDTVGFFNELLSLASNPKATKEENATAIQALKNRVPRVLAGEKGVLTDKDVERTTGSATILDSAKRMFNKLVGTGAAGITRDLEEIKQIQDSLKGVYDVAPNIFAKAADDNLKSTVGGNAEFTKMFPHLAGSQQVAQQTTGQAPVSSGKLKAPPAGEIWVTAPNGQRGSIKAERLNEFLKKGYKEVQ